ncbi:MAG TPA: NDP-sugar synthase [Candidatus Brocadiia bacterium]|nr:NDP-sugar synthase [Candidatus Brocadiia bacterium]
MRAIIFAASERPAMEPLSLRFPSGLLPLVDRPFVQHVVESLVEQGVNEFDFVLSHLPDKMEDLLGNGERWGARFTHHLARDADRPYSRLRVLRFSGPDEVFLLGQGDRLAALDVREGTAPAAPRLFCWRDGETWSWSGWALLRARDVDELNTGLDERAFEEALLGLGLRNGWVVETPRPLSARTFGDLLDANRRLISKDFPVALPWGREAQEGIWISRNVSLHPTARLEAPVFIGANSRVGEGAALGPGVVVGADCVLDKRCVVRDSVVFPGSYVGEALEVAEALVDKNCLVSVSAGVAVPVVDDFILGNIAEDPIRQWLWRSLAQLWALGVFVAVGPLLAIVALWLKLFGRRWALARKEAVRLPAPEDPLMWKTFRMWRFEKREDGAPAKVEASEGISTAYHGTALGHFAKRFLPGLMNLICNDLSLVGLEPRSAEEIAALPPDWRALYLRSKAGLISEAFVEHGPKPSADAVYSAESFYSVNAGFWHDLKLLMKYFLLVVNPFLRRPARIDDLASEDE